MLCLSPLFSSASAHNRAMWRLAGSALLVIALSPLATWAAPEKIHKSQRKSPPLQESANAGDVGLLPRQVEAALQKNWEIMGHGFVQGPMHKLENQQEAIQATMDTIKRFCGKAPVGWESPGLTENDHTLDCLSAAGIEYVADWVIDDQPVWLQAKPKPVLSVPYTVEINDIPMMLLQHNRADEMLVRGIDQFERLWQESAEIPRVMAISVHPYVTGVPHRIGYFEKLLDHIQSRPGVLIKTGEQISNWYREQVPS
jgi:peptidoglycan/xylan/chitin deacetylase (PgdA/CDA1 family)